MSNTYLDSVYKPWLVGLIYRVCKYIIYVFQEETTGATKNLNLNNSQLVTDWESMFQNFKWSTKPSVIKGSLVKGIFDILLSANNSTDC